MEGPTVRTITMPTPYAVGPVNAYLIDAEPLTLIDAGINTPESKAAMWAALQASGHGPEAIERIIVTHAHPDHYGLIHEIQEVSDAVVYFPEREIERVRDKQMLFEVGRLLVEAGMPLDLLFKMDQERRKDPGRSRLRHEEVIPIAEGYTFAFDDSDLVLESFHMPGHTGGHMVFLDASSGTLFAGDQLLPDVSPNPLLEPSLDEPGERRRSLREYMASLERMSTMELQVAYPGHGGRIDDPKALIDSTIEHHLKRKARIGGMLTAEGVTPYRLAEQMYPHVTGYDVFLAVSEIVAHLDLVVDDGAARIEDRDGVTFYFAA